MTIYTPSGTEIKLQQILNQCANVVGIGVDLLDVHRIQKAYEKFGFRYAARILTQIELEEFAEEANKIAYLAKRWAAKEAVVKSLGTGFRQGIVWQQISIYRGSMGKPLVELTGAARDRLNTIQATDILLSLSDEVHQVLAFAVAVKDGP